MFDITQERAAYLIEYTPPGGGSKVELVFHLKYPDGPTIRQYFQEVNPTFRFTGDEIEYLTSQGSHAADLLADHLEQVTYRDGREVAPVETVLKQLRSPRGSDMARAVVNGALFNCEQLSEDQAESETEEKPDVFEELFKQRPVYVCVSQYDPEENIVVDHAMRATLSEPTLEQRRQYDAARPVTQPTRRRKGEPRRAMRQEENVPVIDALFNARCTSLEGAGYPSGEGGELVECNSTGGWQKQVPYHIKSRILQADAGSTTAGNA